jgi:Tol biopolymer transport system component
MARDRATDGSNMQELSVPIRPDLTPYTPGSDSMAFFAMGQFHWLLVSTGSKIFVYDLDSEQWMPPWSHSTNYLRAGESAAGSYQLFSCDATTFLTQLVPTGSNFDLNASLAPVLYQPIFKLSHMALVPDFGTRFSASALSFYDEPTRTGYPSIFQFDSDGSQVSDVLNMVDDDPLNASSTYTSVLTGATTPGTAYNRSQGTFLVQNVYRMTKPTGRFISWKVIGTAANNAFKVYGFLMGYVEKQ